MRWFHSERKAQYDNEKKVAAFCTPYTSNILVQKRLKKKKTQSDATIINTLSITVLIHLGAVVCLRYITSLSFTILLLGHCHWIMICWQHNLYRMKIKLNEEKKKIIAKYWLKCIRNNGEQMLTQINIHGRD